MPVPVFAGVVALFFLSSVVLALIALIPVAGAIIDLLLEIVRTAAIMFFVGWFFEKSEWACGSCKALAIVKAG